MVGNGSVTIDETLYLGLDAGTTGTNIIRSGGSLSVGDLVIADGSQLDLLKGGTFAIDGAFDAADWLTNGFNWGEGAKLTVGDALTGMASTNGFKVLDGSRDLTLDGSNAVWDISGEELIVGFDSAGSVLSLLNDATMTNATTYIGWDTNSANSQIVLNFGSTWVNTNDLWIGYGSNSNALFVGFDSTNTVGGNVYIGNTNTSGNYVQVDGSNAFWDVTGEVTVGSSTGGVLNALLVYNDATASIGGNLTVHSSNDVVVANGGLLKLGGDLNVFSNSALSGNGTIEFTDANAILNLTGESIGIDAALVFQGAGNNTVKVTDGTFLVAGSLSNQYLSFQTLDLTDSNLEGYGALEAATFGAVSLTGGTINPYSVDSHYGTLEIGGNLTLGGGTLYTAQVTTVGHDLLVVDTASVDLGQLDLGVFVPISAIDTNIPILIATNGGFTGTFASTNIVDRMLLFDSELVVDLAGTASIRTSANNDQFSSSLEYAGGESIRAGFNGMKNSVFTRTKQMRRNLVATAHSIPHEAFLLTSTNGPAGAMGPGDQNIIMDMNIWMQYFTGQGSYDGQGKSHGFELNNNGTTIGADKLFGDALTLGFNYTYARGDARTSNLDTLVSETYWFGGYGEWVGEGGLYVDALAAFGKSNYDSVRREQNYEGTAAYGGTELGGSMDVGQYYYYKNFALSPYVGLNALFATAEGHEESDTAGSQVYVDESKRKWIESTLGLKARHRFDTRKGRFQTTGYAEWAHDFVQDDVQTTMSANGLGSVSMAHISPDADTLNTGLGLSWICTDYLEVGVGYNGRFSERYEAHTGSLMFDVRF